jgi:hypothetical protein
MEEKAGYDKMSRDTVGVKDAAVTARIHTRPDHRNPLSSTCE